MAMRKSIRRELNKLRELARHFLEGETCCFCHKPWLPPNALDDHEHGSGTGSPLLLDVTIHHRDGDHFNNAKANRTLAHRACHRRHHATLPWGNGQLWSNGTRKKRAA